MASVQCKKLFEEAVKRVLAAWSALQLAVEHGMAGPNGKALADQFVDHVIETFFTNEYIEEDEVVDILADAMDTHFNTLCEDNSPEEVGNVLWTLFQLCKDGKNAELEVQLSKLPTCQHKLGSVAQSASIIKAATPPTQDMQILERVNEDMEMDPEWTLVSHRKKRQE